MKYLGHGKLNEKITELGYMQANCIKVVVDDVKVADERMSQLPNLDEINIKKEGDHPNGTR